MIVLTFAVTMVPVINIQGTILKPFFLPATVYIHQFVLYRCHCDKGFQGGDCSEHICPFGPAWADEATGVDKAHNLAECSNRGLCSRVDGVCSCMDGFTGHACERMACSSSCNYNGKCMSMYKLASTTRFDFTVISLSILSVLLSYYFLSRYFLGIHKVFNTPIVQFGMRI